MASGYASLGTWPRALPGNRNEVRCNGRNLHGRTFSHSRPVLDVGSAGRSVRGKFMDLLVGKSLAWRSLAALGWSVGLVRPPRAGLPMDCRAGRILPKVGQLLAEEPRSDPCRGVDGF